MPAVIRPGRYRGEVLQMDLSAGGQIIRLDDDTHRPEDLAPSLGCSWFAGKFHSGKGEGVAAGREPCRGGHS
jgi:hypothetical protein